MRFDVKAKTNFPSVKITEEMCNLDEEEPSLSLMECFPFEEPCDVFSPEFFLDWSTWPPCNFLDREWLEEDCELAETRFDLLGNLFIFRDGFSKLGLRRGASLSFWSNS